jgi:hypothetical protein
MSTKKCGNCKEEKNISEYYTGKSYSKLKHSADNYCKTCRNGRTLKIQRGPATVFCTVDNCGKRHYAKGYCRLHYDRVRSTGRTESILDIIPLNGEKQFYRMVDGKKVKHVLYSLESRLQNQYNITVDEFNEFAKDGCNVCGAATGSVTDRNLHVDHDHACCPGQRSCGDCVRGVVCNRCNTSVGLYEKGKLRDDYPNRDKIIVYLQNYIIRRNKLENIKTLHDVFVDPQGKYKEW